MANLKSATAKMNENQQFFKIRIKVNKLSIGIQQ